MIYVRKCNQNTESDIQNALPKTHLDKNCLNNQNAENALENTLESTPERRKYVRNTIRTQKFYKYKPAFGKKLPK